jgi:hypothetical protein
MKSRNKYGSFVGLMLEGKGGSSNRAPPKEATNEEKAAMERWKQNDQQMDSQLDTII